MELLACVQHVWLKVIEMAENGGEREWRAVKETLKWQMVNGSLQ